MEFDLLPGTPGLTLDQVEHVLVPGYGRSGDGTGLTPGGLDRCRTGLDLHRHLGRGMIVCSGYKSPADGQGRPHVVGGVTFQGVPEADLMRTWLLAAGAPAEAVRAERHSIDTVTNLLRSDPLFGDDRPVAIVSHRPHLQRILGVIAPRTLRRPYLGVVVPAEVSVPERPLITVLSWLISTGLPPGPAAADVATRRSERLWRAGLALTRRG
ncbi:YdcF family protein [Actinoplanes sp. G11-F43]|uniref:YdcF family protein n=1 Tax=Actinoplanes sp. G11-F43 TaxID=3424130 RepID=UPI003D337A9C